MISNLEKEIADYKKEYDERKYKHDNGINKMNEKKYLSKQKEDEKNIERVEKKKDEIVSLQKEYQVHCH